MVRLQAPDRTWIPAALSDRAVPEPAADRRVPRRRDSHLSERRCTPLRPLDRVPGDDRVGLRGAGARRQLVPPPPRPDICAHPGHAGRPCAARLTASRLPLAPPWLAPRTAR